ncbi:MAG TPA: iron ABC transporter permease [Steroidobacteraceae bacterium]|nr:iron ABC transporter permease [Steroidobacteraceae bacterium]
MDAASARAGPASVAILVALPMAAVVAAIVQGALGAEPALWDHLREYVLARVAANTLVLAVGVVAVAGCLGTALAWLTAACEFPGRAFFSWALLLPMAMPAYVLAFVAVATLDYAGIVPTALRAWLGNDLWLPPIRSAGGVVAVIGIALYPYVYLMARGAFLTHGARVLESAQSLGLGPWQGLFRVAIPLARPWLAGGMALVAMEALADFGAVSVFNYDTFTTAIYESWYGLFSVETALLLALVLLSFVALALAAERLARGRRRYTAADAGARAPLRLALPGFRGWLATAFAGGVFAVAFVLPAVALARWALAVAPFDLDGRYVAYVMRTLALAGMAALACLALAVALGYATRKPSAGRLAHAAARFATLGYAVPGTVLAVGVVTALGAFDSAWRAHLGGDGLWLSGTVLALLFGYVARFLAVAYGPIQGGFSRIRPSLEEAARSLGLATRELISRLHLPLLGAGIGTALLLVFVDVMKEMPITLMTRPFGWDTLAVRVFEMTAEGEWERAALPSLAIVAAGLLPVALLTWRMERAARAA